MPKPKLTPKQRRFVNEYLVDLNGTQAAIRAGYSKKTAGAIADENLKKPEIAEALKVAMKKREERTGITADMVLKELAKIGFSSMKHYAEWGPGGVTLISSETLTEDAAAAVSEVSESISKARRSLRFKLHDKVAALEKIGRHLGMFKDKDEEEQRKDITVNFRVTGRGERITRESDE